MNRDPEREPSGAQAEAQAPSSPTVPVVAARGTEGKPVATEISLVGLANALLNRWKLVVGLPFGAALVAAVVSLLLPPAFTATATFVPELQRAGPSLPGGLAGLASQFGIGVSGNAESPRFYATVLRSRTLLDQVLQTRFPDPREPKTKQPATLLDILRITGDTHGERLETGRRRLAKRLRVRVDNETSVVSVAVETRYPVLSADMANLFVELLNRFNLETRQSSGRESRRFTEERLRESEDELSAAEEELKGFLERNRQFRGAPELQFQHDRLERQVAIRQEVHITLRRQYEEARILEVNDTPVITIIDQAVPPKQRSSPKRKLNVILAFLLGGVLGVFGAFAGEFVERARQEQEAEVSKLSARWGKLKRELTGLVSRRSRS